MMDEELTGELDGMHQQIEDMEDRLAALTKVKESLVSEIHAVQNQVSRLDSTITGMSFQLAGINRSLSETDSLTRSILQTQATQQRQLDDLAARLERLEAK
jgi:chromosome segregation ATPase